MEAVRSRIAFWSIQGADFRVIDATWPILDAILIPGGSQRGGQNPTVSNKIHITCKKNEEKEGVCEKHNLSMVFMLNLRGVGKRKQAFRSILVAKYEVRALREKTSKMDGKMTRRSRTKSTISALRGGTFTIFMVFGRA